MVTISYEEYKTYTELLKKLDEAENDVKYGRVAPIAETFDSLRKILQEA